ncbi:hypothetical protein LIA77_11206 [Sarocladium implicatum]|nr:hypothetical protein LIA77_11206 [Sarocladium implicatum]
MHAYLSYYYVVPAASDSSSSYIGGEWEEVVHRFHSPQTSTSTGPTLLQSSASLMIAALWEPRAKVKITQTGTRGIVIASRYSDSGARLESPLAACPRTKSVPIRLILECKGYPAVLWLQRPVCTHVWWPACQRPSKSVEMDACGTSAVLSCCDPLQSGAINCRCLTVALLQVSYSILWGCVFAIFRNRTCSRSAAIWRMRSKTEFLTVRQASAVRDGGPSVPATRPISISICGKTILMMHVIQCAFQVPPSKGEVLDKMQSVRYLGGVRVSPWGPSAGQRSGWDQGASST